jgi:hypothetical protein
VASEEGRLTMAVETMRDEAGAEVRVETGRGVITALEVENGKRNAHVKIDAEHLREPVTGWLDTFDKDLLERAHDAYEAGAKVEYRVEVRRKGDIDPAISLKELAARQKVRELVGLEVGHAVQKPSQEPRSTPRAAKPPAQVSHEPEPEAEAPRPSMHGLRGRGPRVEEAKPWEGFNSDGSVNLGSYAAQATIGMAALAYELAMQNARTAAADKGVPLKPPDPTIVQNLARRLLRAADKAQAAIRADGHTDRMDASHARARGAVRSAVDVWPPPWGKGGSEWDRWQETLVGGASMVLSVGVDLLAEPYD